MANSLEDRLQEHSNSFNGLLSLIPAKYYYDGETSNQWQQKRKSKTEHQLNKRQKLDPENNKNISAKDVLDETAKTAKPVVLPGEKFKKHQEAMRKAQEEQESDEESDDDVADVGSEELDNSDDENTGDEKANKEKGSDEEGIMQDNVNIIFDDNGDEIVLEQQEFKKAELQQQNQKQKGKKQLTKEEQEERERKHKELKAKLQAKIQTMREKRKAPGSKAPGAATSRQQILEERRRKIELKKQMKNKEEESDDSSDEDDEDDVESIEDANKNSNSNVMFGNIEFLDGERVSSDFTTTRKIGKKKGPANNDIKGHLKKLELQKQKIQDLDSDAKKDLETKSKWKKALASVQGIKVKDDEKLLKKALRRKESLKRKSEREWKDRIQTVKDEKKMKADRREENLRIRKENKGKDRKHQVKQLPSYKRSRGSKKLAGSSVGVDKAGKGDKKGGSKRAGFEGGIRSHKKKK